MKILVYGLNYAPELTGIGKYTSEMSQWLSAKGHQVRVISSYPHYPDWTVVAPYHNYRYSRETIEKVGVIRCPLYVPKQPSGTTRILSHLSFAASSAPILLTTARHFQPDVIFTLAPSLVCAPTALLAAKLCGARSWLHIQDFEVDSAFNLGILSGNGFKSVARTSERNLLQRFDRVSTISPKMKTQLAEKGVAASHLVEFRNWVDNEIIRPGDRATQLRAELDVSQESVVALYSGSMSLKQGLDLLVDAARALRDQRPNLVFLFCGQGAIRDSLLDQASDLSNVRFLDLQPVDRLSELLATADIHLLPQRAEVADLVLPSKLAPMLASGRPVLAMAEPDSQLAAEVAGAGIIIPADNVEALTSALLRLTDDAAERDRLGRRGREFALERWDMEAILRTFEDSLQRLASTTSRPPS